MRRAVAAAPRHTRLLPATANQSALFPASSRYAPSQSLLVMRDASTEPSRRLHRQCTRAAHVSSEGTILEDGDRVNRPDLDCRRGYAPPIETRKRWMRSARSPAEPQLLLHRRQHSRGGPYRHLHRRSHHALRRKLRFESCRHEFEPRRYPASRNPASTSK